MNISFEDEDYVEVKKVAAILNEIENSGVSEWSHILKDIEAFQPFLISLLLGYKDRLIDDELEELAKYIMIIWRFFEDNPNAKETRITKDLYQEVDNKNLDLMYYLSGELSGNSFLETTAIDLSSLKSKALLTALFYRNNEREPQIQLFGELKGEIILGLKSWQKK